MKTILGIDVGGTKIAAGLVNEKFEATEIKTESTSQSDLLAQLISLIESYSSYDGIGLGVPGVVAPDGKIEGFMNIPHFQPTNLKQTLEDKFKLPVSVMNDAEAFTLAEAQVEFKEKSKTFGVILGTGIGGGFVDGKTHQDTGIPFIHQKLPGLEAEMQSQGSFEAAAQAQPFVEKLLPVIIADFNPDLIVFGGSRSYLPGMQQVLDNVGKSIPPQVSVQVSKLEHAGIIGAALPLLKK